MSDHQCQRCGAPLKVETVRVPVYLKHLQWVNGKVEEQNVLVDYDEREEVSDCVRCTGAY